MDTDEETNNNYNRYLGRHRTLSNASTVTNISTGNANLTNGNKDGGIGQGQGKGGKTVSVSASGEDGNHDTNREVTSSYPYAATVIYD